MRQRLRRARVLLDLDSDRGDWKTQRSVEHDYTRLDPEMVLKA